MKIIDRIIILAIVMSAAAACSPKQGAHIRSTKEGFELTVDGSPVFIKGIGGTNRPDIAAASGANACRTWGGSIDDMTATMAMAAENGLYVMQGIWLPKEAEKYADEEFKDQMRTFCREAAERFKDDPNLLIWGIGNEVELSGNNNREIWKFINELSKIIKSVDKRHLTATVIAHNRSALDSIARYAPSLDLVGINSYGSINEVRPMVLASDYKGPYIITEWGPTGWWETDKTSWGAPIEQTGDEKRKIYEARYKNAVLYNPLCLGSFVFLWGQKEERTPTWFSMFVEDGVEGLPLNGEKTPSVEAMHRLWTGMEPDRLAPVVKGIRIDGKSPADSPETKSGDHFRVEVSAQDRDGDTLQYVWEILHEATVLGFGGSYEPRPDRYGEVVVTDKPYTELKIDEAGNYRVYVYVLDGTGYVSTANSPIRIL